MRVIAGSAGGIPLFTPRADVRPTMDRVKEAIFSSLGDKVIGARVLDLFAGSGALGIEALSRGCASATFVEKNGDAVETLQRNLVKTHLHGEVQPLDVFRFLTRCAAGAYDIIFADPPYKKQPDERDFGTELVQCVALREALAADGIFVLEKLPHLALSEPPEWEILRAKRYGSTEVAFLRAAVSSP